MKLKTLVPALCATALAAGCAVNGTGAPVRGEPARLNGHSFMWTGGVSEDCELPPYIAFDADGRVSGQAGCNRLLGQVVQDGLRVDFSNLGSTMKLCAPQFMKVEREFLDIIGRTAFATQSAEADGAIDIWSAEGEKIVTLVAEKPGKCD